MRILPCLAIAAILTGGSAYAQVDAETKGAIELTRRAIQAKRQEIVNTAMDLTDQESEAFWRLYRDWRAKMAGVGDRKVELLTQIDEHYDELSDQQARAMLDEWLKTETDILKLRKDYVKRFRKIMPEKKVARFFQLESKLDATVAYDLAGRIPLVE